MQRKLYKELWLLRFQKMLDLEEGAIREYQELLRQLKDDIKLKEKFETLIQDETQHAKLIRQLIEIVHEQAD